MHSQLTDLLQRLKDVVEAQGDPDRTTALEAALSAEQPIIPLIHRTGDPAQGNTLESILMDGYLRPPKQLGQEENEFDLNSAVYFFYGVGAYPKGRVAFAFHPRIANRGNSTFTPFDTGALLATPPYLVPTVHNPSWNDPKVRRDFIAGHTGQGKDLDKFAGYYLNAHFRNIDDYITKPQQSTSDWLPYHGLKSLNGDRRAWTIETRIPHRIPLKRVQAIFLDSGDLHLLVGDKYFKHVIIRQDSSADLGEVIAKFVIEKIIAPQPVKLFRHLLNATYKFFERMLRRTL